VINQLHAKFHRPEMGWDPVPTEQAIRYSKYEWETVNDALLTELELWVGGFEGKRILDLGGGPGQYSLAFAMKGGVVTWRDVSRSYLNIAQERIKMASVSNKVKFSLGYLDEVSESEFEPFDLVFNRICWNYGFNDRSFAKIIYRMVRPGGFCYIDTENSRFQRDQLSMLTRFRTWLNDWLGIKIGHPYPPHGRLARIFVRYPVKRFVADYRSPLNDRLFFERQAVDQ
jgi:2-polyprenyl-3-methyl-5-hydroxy-6-metoxy-1,4-benzoquinol methylase